MSSTRMLGLAALCLSAAAGAAHAASYSFSQITIPGSIVSPGGDQGQALAINDLGQVLVSALSYDSAADDVDFNAVYNINTKTFANLPAVPGSVAGSTLANGINDNGEIVGQYDPGAVVTPDGNLSAFSYAAGTYATLNPLNTTDNYVFALAVSNNGLITGADDNLDSGGNVLSSQGFVGSGSAYQSIQYPPGAGAGAIVVGRGVNDSGTVAGYYGLDSGASGLFLSKAGVITDITNPAAVYALPGQINDAGMLVGYTTFDPTYSAWEGFVYDNGSASYLNFPGSTQTFGLGINDEGDVVGQYLAPDGSYQAFLAVPVPEPGAWSMMLVGFAALGVAARRRQPGRLTVAS